MSVGLVIVFSPKGNESKVFTRVFGHDGNIFFPINTIQSIDADGLVEAARKYRQEYCEAVNNTGTVHKVAAVEIPDELEAAASDFLDAMQKYQSAEEEEKRQRSIKLTEAFVRLQTYTDLLNKNIEKA